MKEHEGGNEVLTPLMKILENQDSYELILQKDVKDSHLLLCKNGLCWYYEGLIEISPSTIVELCLNGVIEVNPASHRLLRVNGEEVNGIEHNQVLDLSDDGERWEGDVLHNQPFGWGVMYDSENRMVYEGFRIGDVNVCYGTQYYSDIGVIEYEGEWFEGKRWGRGVHYDRTGKTVFEGEWHNDEHLSKHMVLNVRNQQVLNSHIEELVVQDSSCNGMEWRVLDLSIMSHLRLLEVGDECFEKVNEVKLVGLNQLERVVIGQYCFTRGAEYIPNAHFYLKNCERLRELKIGPHSLSDYSVCLIENLPSLEVIEIGEPREWSHNFWRASLELKSGYQRMM